MTRRILCVDADERDREETVETLNEELRDLDVEFVAEGTVADAEGVLDRTVDAVITEYDLPDGTGFDLITAAADACPDAGCILFTDTDPATLDTTELRGALSEYVGKESLFGRERLAELVRTTVEARAQGSYPIPQNEPERLAALRSYDLDDPDLVASLDRVTDMAADYFGVQSASINIINEHSQEFLSCYGSAEDWETMDREDSICTFTILEDDDLMIVEDVTEDPRFETRSETLLDMGIHSYMGATLVTDSGLAIGPLCVYDDEPRSFSQGDRAYLRNAAAVAMDLIDLHARLDPIGSSAGDDR